MPAFAQSKPWLTEINDTLYRADGTLANGSLIISWPAFITGDRQPVAAGSKVVAIGTKGLVITSLVPTTSSTPSGIVYKVVAKMKDGTTFTEYWSVPATPMASIASMRVTPSTVSPSAAFDAAVAKKLDRSGDTPVTLGDLRFASQFPGTDAGKQIGSAASNCQSGPCVVVAPSTMGAGAPSPLPDNVALIDFRESNSPNASGHESSAYGYGLLARRQFVLNPGLSITKGALGAYCAALAGGTNRGSDEAGGWFKANYLCGGVIGTWRTPGQHSLFGASGNNYSLGDHSGLTTMLYDWGGPSAAGDESTQGVAARLYEGEAIFSATVAGIAADTVNFLSASNADTLGEGRYLINTTPAKTHSAGTVASVSGKTFTFTGAGIQSRFGDGPKGNICLALDGNTMNTGSTAHKLVNLITSTSGETATIEWRLPGNTYPARLATSGTYTIYPCSPVTYVGVSYQPGVTTGSIKVADPTVFAANDTIQLPVWYQHTKTGVSAVMSSTGYNGGALLSGSWNGPGWLRNGISVSGGNVERGLEFSGGSIAEYGILFNRTIGNDVSILADTPVTGATSHIRRFLSTYTGQGNQTSLGFQMDPANGGYWYMGRALTNFTTGENGVAIGAAPQSNQKLAVITTGPSQLGLAIWNSGSVKASISGDGAVSARSIGGIQFADPTGSQTGGIAESYAACTTAGSGCTVVLRGDITISSPQTITVTADKPLIIDLAGHTVTCTNNSGSCLTIVSNNRTPWAVRNGRLVFGGTGTATALRIDTNTTFGQVSTLKIKGFHTGLSLYGAMENSFEDVNLQENTTGLVMDNSSNANHFRRVALLWNGTQAIIKGGTSSVYFSGCTIQGGNGTNAVVIQSKGSDPNSTSIRFDQTHFEANGDGTANSSAVLFDSDAGHYIVNVTFSNSVFSGGSNGSAGVVFRFAGSGTSGVYLTTLGNKYGGFAATQAGLTSNSAYTAIGNNDSNVTKENYDVGLSTSFGPGLTFNPVGATHAYGIHAGSPANTPNGYLQFKDYTTGQSILTYNGSTWSVPKDTWFGGWFGGSLFRLTVPATKPACNAGNRGTITYTAGAAGMKDSVEVCAKDAADTYSWRTIY